MHYNKSVDKYNQKVDKYNRRINLTIDVAAASFLLILSIILLFRSGGWQLLTGIYFMYVAFCIGSRVCRKYKGRNHGTKKQS